MRTPWLRASRPVVETPRSWCRGVRRVRRARQPGQALVEFSLGITAIALLLVAASDFPITFYYDVVTSTAASQGARAAAAGAPDADVVAAARAGTPSTIASGLSVSVAPAAADRTSGLAPTWTTVTVGYTYSPVTPLVGAFLGSSKMITRSSSQRMRAPCVVADGTPCS